MKKEGSNAGTRPGVLPSRCLHGRCHGRPFTFDNPECADRHESTAPVSEVVSDLRDEQSELKHRDGTNLSHHRAESTTYAEHRELLNAVSSRRSFIFDLIALPLINKS